MEQLRKVAVIYIKRTGVRYGVRSDRRYCHGFYSDPQLISVLALVVVVCLFYQSPKESFKFLVFLVIVAIAGYFVLQLGGPADTSVSTKKKLVNKTKKALDD